MVSKWKLGKTTFDSLDACYVYLKSLEDEEKIDYCISKGAVYG